MHHPTSLISPDAKLGAGVKIGPFTIVHGNVEIGDDSVIGGHCEIGQPTPLAEGRPLVIGRGALIRSHSVFYEGSSFGDGLTTGHRVTVREGIVAGRSLQIGTAGDFQGHCTIGDHVRSQSNVFVGQGARIGNFVWLLPYVVLTNDPHPPSNVLMGVEVEDFAAIAAAAVILPGVKVGRHSLVAACSLVNRDVEPHTVVAGVPAKPMGPTSAILLRDGSGRPAYPWTTHFTRGYPPEVVARWQAGEAP